MTLRKQAINLALEHRKSFSVIQSLTQNLIETGQFVRDDITQQGQEVGVANSVEHEKTRREFKISMDKVTAEKLRETFMRTLGFLQMQDRHRTIAEAHEQTFRWIFANPGSCNLSWSNFVNWLRHDNGLYWISGKAGSGKSTLMRYVVENSLTLRNLSVWSDTESLVTASFFFWSSGSEEQRSYTGLLRSLLYDILLQRPELLPLVLSSIRESQWHGSLSEIQFENHKWSLSELKRAFTLVTDYSVVPLKFCFFIDGLDEYSGDHEEMAEFLKQVAISAHVKFCISSRPWIVFEDTFQDLPMLRLQDLTYGDIKAYVADKLERHPKMRDLSKKEPAHSFELIKEIVSKASGVFLWVVIVVSNLLNGLRNRDDISDLCKRLLIFPAELENLYTHMLEQVDTFYQERASRTFQIYRVLSGFQREELMCPLFIDFAITSTYETTTTAGFEPICHEEVHNRRAHLDWHLKSHCAGLIEIHDIQQGSERVSYLHRTVQDFIETGPVQAWIVQRANTEFDPNISIIMSLIMRIKQVLSPPHYHTLRHNSWEMALKELEAIMLRAQAAEKGGMLKKSMKYAELLDEADQVGTVCVRSCKQYVPSKHWSEINKIQARQGAGFLAEAVSYGLRTYVMTKLEEENNLLLQSSINNLLLIHAAIPPYGRILESSVPLDMIKVLIRFGANPNRNWRGHTAWQRIMTWIHEYGCRIGAHHLLDWFEIFRVLILSGASLETTCVSNHKLSTSGKTTISHTVVDVVEDVFGKDLPKQTTELFWLVADRRQRNSRYNPTESSPGAPIDQVVLGNKRGRILEHHESKCKKKWKYR